MNSLCSFLKALYLSVEGREEVVAVPAHDGVPEVVAVEAIAGSSPGLALVTFNKLVGERSFREQQDLVAILAECGIVIDPPLKPRSLEKEALTGVVDTGIRLEPHDLRPGEERVKVIESGPRKGSESEEIVDETVYPSKGQDIPKVISRPAAVNSQKAEAKEAAEVAAAKK